MKFIAQTSINLGRGVLLYSPLYRSTNCPELVLPVNEMVYNCRVSLIFSLFYFLSIGPREILTCDRTKHILLAYITSGWRAARHSESWVLYSLLLFKFCPKFKKLNHWHRSIGLLDNKLFSHSMAGKFVVFESPLCRCIVHIAQFPSSEFSIQKISRGLSCWL